jgi:hypothetical protein
MKAQKTKLSTQPPLTANRLLCAVFLFLKIVWRKWDTVEVEEGKWVTLRIDWSTAWDVSKGIWLS